jgi:hypothetical protein
MDEYQDKASFTTFEKCISPFFKDENISYENIFKELCGKKKKFLNMKRLIKGYLTYKSGRKMNEDCKRFFKKLFEELMKTGSEVILNEKPKVSKMYSSDSSKNRGMITKLKILTGKTGIIRGLNIEYDDVVRAKMYDKKNEEVYHQSELVLDVIETEGKKNEDQDIFSKVNPINEYLVRDSITHVYGTYTTKIEFLGFKTRTGKFYFEGIPKGKGFIYGEPNKQFHYCRFNIDHDQTKGMTCFQPAFVNTSRINENLKFTLKDMTQSYLKDDPLIAEEENLQNMDENDPNLDKFILSAPVIDDSQFLSMAVKLINQNPECNFENVCKKEERQYQESEHKTNVELPTLSLSQILNGTNLSTNMLRSGRKNLLRSVKKPKKPRKKMIPENKKNTTAVLKNKKNFKSLMNDLGNNIKDSFNKEKERLRGKLKGKFNEEEDDDRPRGVLRGGKRLRGSKNKASQSQSKNSSGSIFDGIFSLFGGSSSSSSSSKNYSASQPKTQKQTSSSALSVENFFDCFNNAGDDDIDTLFNLNNDELMKMFYTQNKNTNSNKKTTSNTSTKTTTNTSQQQYSQNPQTYNVYGYGGYSGYSGYNGYGNYGYNYNQGYGGYSPYGYNYGGQTGYSPYGYNNNLSNYGFNDQNYQKKEAPQKEQKKASTIKADPEADKRAKENWTKVIEKVKENQGFHILQTVGACIKAITALQKDEKQEHLSLNEKIRLYQILEENERIVDFLSQNNKDPEEVDEEDEPEEEIQGLDEIDYLDLDQLNQRMETIEEIKKTHKNKDNIRKLEIIYNACIDRKNLLIKQEEEEQRKKMIEQQKINEEALKKKEEEARKKAQEEKKNLLDNLLNKEIKNKIGENMSKIQKRVIEEGVGGGEKMTENEKKKLLEAKPDEKHVYRNQKFPDGLIEFRDPLFPPEKKTLCDFKGNSWVLPPDGIPEDVEGWEDYTWARAGDILKHSFEVFNQSKNKNGKAIEDDDIIQGTLGDCYFLSAIAALAKEDILIKRLFYTQNYNKTGAYGVFYMMNGEWKLVIIDDYFPCTSGKINKKFVFSNNNGFEIWVMLLEKAWAKINGNYARIGCGGQPHEVFEVTTEAFSERIKVPEKSQEREELWEKLIRAQESRFIMTAGTGVSDETEEMGLATGHAYTLTHVYDLFPNNKKKRVRLVHLRNPWGNGEWTGDFCDDSELWTMNNSEIMNELLKQMRAYYKDNSLTFEEKDDGEFFMRYEDFVKFYVVLGICHINPRYQYKTIKISANKKDKNDGDDDLEGRLIDRESGINGPVITKLIVECDNTDVYLRICQKNMRYKPKSENHHTSHVLEFIMLLDSKFNYISSESNDEPTTCIRTTVNAGTYYIITDINYRYQGHNHGYVISAYSDKNVDFQMCKNENLDVPKLIRNASAQLMKDVYAGKMTEGEIDKTLRQPVTYKSKKPENYGDGALLIYTGKTYSSRVPYLSVLFENTTSDKEISIETEIKKYGAKRFEVYCDEKIDPTAEKFSIEIPPKSSKILLINKFDYDSKIGLSYGMKIYGSGSKPASADVNDDAVFNRQPSPIDSKGLINSYYLQAGNGFILGIDNSSSRDLNFKLSLTGLQISEGANKGSNSVVFSLKRQTRQTFRVSPDKKTSKLSFVFSQV